MSTTQISPLPKLRFVDGNGNALSGGLLFTYAAGTTTKLATYTDQTGATPNTNPIVLDSRGECNCWLTPATLYKLVLSPSTDTDPPTNAIWTVDNVSSGISLPVAPSQGGTPLFFGGATTGSANAQTLATVTPSNFTLTAGYRVGFVAGLSNTGATTINVNSTGATAIKKASPNGLVALTGGEIVANCSYTLEYDGTQFQLLNPSSLDLADQATKSAPTVSDGVAIMDAAASNVTKTATLASLRALAADLVAGTSTILALTPKSLADNIVTGNPGYIKLPGGLIIQWGIVFALSNTTTTQTLGVAFPNQCDSIVTSYEVSSSVPAGAAGATCTKTTVTVFNASGASALNISWIAIGH